MSHQSHKNSQDNSSLYENAKATPHYQTADKSLAKELIQHSKNNRKEPTAAEALVWNVVRNKNLGEKFRRQHAIGRYIADFVCIEKRLIVEIDGGYHNTKEQKELDYERTLALEQKHLFTIIRFTNQEVLEDMGTVISKIKDVLGER